MPIFLPQRTGKGTEKIAEKILIGISEEQALVPDTGRYRQIQMLSQIYLQEHLNLSVQRCRRQRVPALAAFPLCPSPLGSPLDGPLW